MVWKAPMFSGTVTWVGLSERSSPSVLNCPVLNLDPQFLDAGYEGRLLPNVTNISYTFFGWCLYSENICHYCPVLFRSEISVVLPFSLEICNNYSGYTHEIRLDIDKTIDSDVIKVLKVGEIGTAPLCSFNSTCANRWCLRFNKSNTVRRSSLAFCSPEVGKERTSKRCGFREIRTTEKVRNDVYRTYLFITLMYCYCLSTSFFVLEMTKYLSIHGMKRKKTRHPLISWSRPLYEPGNIITNPR